MLLSNPVFWDDKNKLWAIYSYAGCRRILTDPYAQIPALNNRNMNEYALLMSGKFARLNNPPQHQAARHVAMALFEKLKQVSLPGILENLIQSAKRTNEIDWVNIVCKKLPLLALLKGFEFINTDIEFMENKIQTVVKIMLPDKTTEQIDGINEIAEEIYKLTEKNITRSNYLRNIIDITVNDNEDEILALCVSNLISLLIQSYDAGRGLLSNSLMQILLHKDSAEINLNDNNYFVMSVLETLRFDPPVHNTRRILADDIFINEKQLNKGETILIVLAAANRDPGQFSEPDKYDIDRHNNSQHLTFGTGNHMCIARYFSMNLASEALSWLFHKNKKVRMLAQKIEYEPIVNARLPKELFISLS
jgi:cytochrome P450